MVFGFRFGVALTGGDCSYRPQANWGGQLLLINWCRKSKFKRIGSRKSIGAHLFKCRSMLLQAVSAFQGHESTPDRAECNLYVHGSRPGRAEGALYVQPACLDVQRILRTFKLSSNSTDQYIGSKNLISRTPPFTWPKHA